MTHTPPPSIGLDFLMQGVAERVNEKQKHHLLENRRGKEADTKIQTSFKMELENIMKNCIQCLFSLVK